MASERESKQSTEARKIYPGDKYVQKFLPLIGDRNVKLDSPLFQAFEDYVDRQDIDLQECEEWQRENDVTAPILDRTAIEERIRQRKANPEYASAYEQFERWGDEYKTELHDVWTAKRDDVREGRVNPAFLPHYKNLLDNSSDTSDIEQVHKAEKPFILP